MKRMASEFYHNLAKEAAKKRIVIDLFSYSQYSIGVKILSVSTLHSIKSASLGINLSIRRPNSYAF